MAILFRVLYLLCNVFSYIVFVEILKETLLHCFNSLVY